MKLCIMCRERTCDVFRERCFKCAPPVRNSEIVAARRRVLGMSLADAMNIHTPEVMIGVKE